ncbi:MAG: FHA domain-containing protein [Chitinophagales bacterium]|nr:FHA domain-containing protein [Chitinophagales bacterium]
MSWENYKKKCSKCGYINEISADWFNNNLETKQYSCPSCNYSVLLKVSAIRKTFYNNFALETQLVGMKSRAGSCYLKVTHNADKGFFDIKRSVEYIEIGRGNTLSFWGDELEKSFVLQIPDRYISKKHALINIIKQGEQKVLVLKDSNSMNGTVYNQVPLHEGDEIILQNNGIIKIGETEIEVIY